jgi:hypothetical protein
MGSQHQFRMQMNKFLLSVLISIFSILGMHLGGACCCSISELVCCAARSFFFVGSNEFRVRGLGFRHGRSMYSKHNK